MYLHYLRYRTPFLIALTFITVVFAAFGIMYPGAETMESFVAYFEFLVTIEVDNPGFYLWILFLGAFLYMVYPSFIGIFIGVNVMPYREKDGKELLVTSSKPTWKFYLENAFLMSLLIILIFLPGFIISIIFLVINDAIDSLTNLSIAFTLGMSLAIISGLIAGLGSAFKYSKTSGYLIGGSYVAISFLIDLAKSIEGFDKLSDFSIHSQAKVVQHSFEGTWNTEFLIFSLVFSLILILLTLFVLYRKDFLEGGVRVTKIEEEDFEQKKGFFSRFTFITKPVHFLISRISWKYAALRDQLHAHSGIMTFFVIFGIFLPVYAVVMFAQGGEGEIEQLLAGFQMPLFDAALFNHTMTDSSNFFMYFIAYELFAFAWMIYGPFVLLVIYNLLMRDKKSGYAEVTWSLSRNNRQIFLGRTVAALGSVIVIFFSSFITVVLMSNAYGESIDLYNTFMGFVTLAWSYCVLLVLLLAITLAVPHRHTLKVLVGTYVVSVLLIFASFLGDTPLLLFLTPLGYFDAVGVFIGNVAMFTELVPRAFLGTVLVYVLFHYVLKYRLPQKDYLV
jgi:preprotein translocase subunit Sss1